jgi:hypothetical protein
MLSASQLMEWEAYDSLDPVGSWREDIRVAYLSSLITNLAISTHGKKGSRLTKVEDFMLEWDEEAREAKQQGQSTEEIKEILLSFANTHNEGIRKQVAKGRKPHTFSKAKRNRLKSKK